MSIKWAVRRERIGASRRQREVTFSLIDRRLAPFRSLNVCLAILAFFACNQALAAPQFWAASPYQVRLIVVADSPQLSDARLLADFERTFAERLSRGVRPLWQPRIEIAPAEISTAIASRLLGTDPFVPEAQQPSDPQNAGLPVDKTILVIVQETPGGFQVAARELDGVLDRWGTVVTARAASWPALVDATIDATSRAFSPIAAFELDPENPTQVRLAFRGEELGKKEPIPLGKAQGGDVLLPYLRRVSRDGTPLPGGVQRAPWTYLVASPTDAESPATARIYSHARTPFGTRRRGRIEQLALVVHTTTDRPTILRLHDRKNVDQPLAGYEVFVSPQGSKDLRRLGRSNAAGEMAISADATGQPLPVLMAHIKVDSSVVASLPIAAGVETRLSVPLLDERQRLAAETKVAALREELVDLVARRRIFATRIRQRLADEDIPSAERLLRQVESLPGMAQFNQRLAHTEQLYRANDPTVQRRLNRLFTETRSVLGSALDARELRRLANEVLEAKRAGGA